jgi:iron complex transport system ATP-binding protein
MTTKMATNMISADRLRAGYGDEEVLKGITFDVEPGEFVGILGPNACGKSTLVKALTGVLERSGGGAELGGLDPDTVSPREIARLAAVVPQSTAIPFPFTGEEVVSMGRFAHLGRFAAPSPTDRKAVLDAMERTDTVKLADRLITQVSGGERQRLIMARALAQQAPLLILDEATAAMDVHRKIDTFDLLRELNDAGTTVVAVMHDLNLAALYCKRLVMMRAGELAADGATAEVFNPATLEAVYDTPMEVFTHEATGRPHAIFLPRRKEQD